jgi:hypothetical protein
MEEFEIFRKSVITSLEEQGALITSYKDRKAKGYYGGITLLKSRNEIRVNRPNLLQIEATYVSRRGNTRENPGWKPHVERNAWISWEPDYIGNEVVFKINDSKFVSEFGRVIRVYEHQDILSKKQLMPYYLPLFIKPISGALSSDRIDLIFPKDEIKKKKAVKHLE